MPESTAVKEAQKTTTIKFYGASDDLVEIEGIVKGCDECSAWNSGDGTTVNASFRIADGQDSMLVHAVYDRSGEWAFAPGRDCIAGMAKQLPTWPIRLRNPEARETPYSTVLEIDVPKTAIITRLTDENVEGYDEKDLE